MPQAWQWLETPELQQLPLNPKSKKTAGKDDGKLRFGFIGTGSRCHEHINNVLAIPGNKIVAICDIQQGPIDSTLKHIAKFNVPAPKVYKGGEREFENMLNNEEFDCVIIASPWEWHVPMSVAAMKAGVPYVGVEVSAANTLEECWGFGKCFGSNRKPFEYHGERMLSS